MPAPSKKSAVNPAHTADAAVSSPDTAVPFEVAIERLESIVGRMENDQVNLADLLGLYEEGLKLLRGCDDQLKKAEKRIEVLTRASKGFETEEFTNEVQVGREKRSQEDSPARSTARSELGLY